MLSHLGEGGMGRVYAVEHVLMRKRLAVKILHRELTTVREVVERFEREAMAAANIDHPNVAAATDFGRLADGSIFLVLEYVQGQSLRTVIQQGPLGVSRALHIAEQVASALKSAHALGIVHRDLKPENVMLVGKGGDPDFVKVLDFGIAKVPIQAISERGSIRPGQVITKVGMVFGTPEYMAPEQALGQDVDGRADLFSLGMILFEMLAGVRPFRSKSPVGLVGQLLKGELPSIAECEPSVTVPSPVEALVRWLLAAERDQRPSSAEAVAVAIQQIVAQDPELAPASLSAPFATSRVSLNSSSGLAELELPPDLRAVVVPGQPPPSHGASLPGTPPRFSERRPWGLMNPLFRLTDQWRIRLPSSVQSALVDIKTPVLALFGVGTVLGLVLVVVGLVVVAFRTDPKVTELVAAPSAGPSAIDRVSRISTSPTHAPAELEQAKAKGLGGLTALAEKYPTDAEVRLELAKVMLADGRAVLAMATLQDALGADPRIMSNPQLATFLWNTVQRRDTMPAAFSLLETRMGTRGADILYDLSTTAGVRAEVRQRAEQFFSSGLYRSAGSAALRVLIDLREASSCRERLLLLPKVERDADARILPHLEEMSRTTGCGADRRGDCFPCLRNDTQLERATQAVRGRAGH